MPDLVFEQEYDGAVCGIDEVGRGPLAGPVVAACVYIPSHVYDLDFWALVNDSKKLSARKRDTLAVHIQESCICGIGMASVSEIDQHNILQATFMAMRRAFDIVQARADMVAALVDGNRPPPLPVPAKCVVKGDSKSLSIAAASIIAKVARDRMMADLHTLHPQFGWDRNAGYGTAMHLRALGEFGPTQHHRVSFAPVAAAIKS